MSFFGRFRKKPTKLVEEPREDQPLTVRSRGLQRLLAGWPPSSGPRILDLGTASSAKLEFYRRFDARIRVENLWSTLSAATAVESSRTPELMEPSTGERYDIVFVWDLLNYTSPKLMAALSPALLSYCHSDSLLFLLVWNRPNMPTSPLSFFLQDERTMKVPASAGPHREAPLYTQTDLSRNLPDFEVEQSFLLKMGLQEYILRPRTRG